MKTEIDVDGNWKIDIQEVYKYLCNNMKGISNPMQLKIQSVTSACFKKCNKKKNGNINANEFKYLFSVIIPFLVAMEQFRDMDTDKNGSIDSTEFTKYAAKNPNKILVYGDTPEMFKIVNKTERGVLTVDKLVK